MPLLYAITPLRRRRCLCRAFHCFLLLCTPLMLFSPRFSSIISIFFAATRYFAYIYAIFNISHYHFFCFRRIIAFTIYAIIWIFADLPLFQSHYIDYICFHNSFISYIFIFFMLHYGYYFLSFLLILFIAFFITPLFYFVYYFFSLYSIIDYFRFIDYFIISLYYWFISSFIFH